MENIQKTTVLEYNWFDINNQLYMNLSMYNNKNIRRISITNLSYGCETAS